MKKSLDKKFFNLTALVLAPVAYLFSVFYYFVLNAPKSGAAVFFGMTLFSVFYSIWQNVSAKVYMNVGVLTYFIIFAFLVFFTGGINSPNVWWLPLGAVISSNFLPKKETAFWSGLIVLFIIFIQLPVAQTIIVNEVSFENRAVFYNVSLTFFALSTALLVYVGKTYAEIIVNENKKTYKLLESQDRLASLGMLAGNITHEINNPLQVLMGASQLINSEINKEVPSKDSIVKHTNAIDDKVKNIAEIVKGLKLLSRDGKNDEIQEIELIELLKEVNQIMTTNLSDFSFKFDVNNQLTNKNFKFMSNRILILRVLTNLITNSVYAIKGLDEKWVQLIVTEDIYSFEMRIVDSGDGIPQDILEKIYEPLFTTKPDGEGTGIGLALCNDIIESLGGKLRYELFNGNTSFLICLPKSLKLRQTS